MIFYLILKFNINKEKFKEGKNKLNISKKRFNFQNFVQLSKYFTIKKINFFLKYYF